MQVPYSICRAGAGRGARVTLGGRSVGTIARTARCAGLAAGGAGYDADGRPGAADLAGELRELAAVAGEDGVQPVADAVVALRRGIFVFATSTQPGDDEPFHRPVLTLSRGGRSAGGAERRRPSGPRRRFVIDKKHAPLSDGSPLRSSTAARPRAPPPCDPASPRRRSATRRPSSRSAPASCSRRSASPGPPCASRTWSRAGASLARAPRWGGRGTRRGRASSRRRSR